MIANRTELSQILGISLTTVDSYVREGMPAEERADRSRGKQWEFDTTKVINWLIARALERERGGARADGGAESWQDARARNIAVTANLRELEYKQKLGELVSIDDVAEKVGQEYAVVKSRLRAIPGRMAQILSPEMLPEEVERRLKEEVRASLAALSEQTL